MKLIFAAIQLACIAAVAAVDRTIIEKQIGWPVVQAVADTIKESCIFSDDALFLRRVAYAETSDGADRDTFGNFTHDYYGGIWNVNEEMFEETKKAGEYFGAIQDIFGINWVSVRWTDLWKPLYSGLAARIYIAMRLPVISRAEEDQAKEWVQFYRGKVSGDNKELIDQYLHAVNITTRVCSVGKADIIFALDSSASIGPGNFNLVREFVVSVVTSFDIGPSNVRIGVLKYSNAARVEFQLDEYNTTEEIADAVRAMPYTKGATQTDNALLLMEEMFAEKGRSEDGVAQICIFMTDGKSTQARKTIEAAEQVHKSQITIFGVGITDAVDFDELNLIGSDPSCVHVYHLKTFDDVVHFHRQIEAQACNAPAEVETETTIFRELVEDEFYFFKMKVTKEDGGVTIVPEVTDGTMELYLSWTTRNPGPERYDYAYTLNFETSIEAIYVPLDDDVMAEEVELYGAVVGVEVLTHYSMVYEGCWLEGAIVAGSTGDICF